MNFKYAFLPLFFTSLFLVVSCAEPQLIEIPVHTDIPEETGAYGERNLYHYVIEAGNEDISSLIEAGSSFIMYLGSSVCSSCQDFKPVLIEYIEKSRATVYYYDYFAHSANHDYDRLMDDYPAVFKDDVLTPSLVFFESGHRKKTETGNSRFTDYRLFKALMDSIVTVIE